MAAWFKLAFVLLLVTCVIAQKGCKDRWSRMKCRRYKRVDLCSVMWRNCKMTCRKCGTSTRPPVNTKPPTTPTKPVTRGTNPPVPTTRSPQPASCGMRQTVKGLVIAGKRASPGAWPWQVRLLKGNDYICGGTLIAPSWVVGATHCVFTHPKAKYAIEVGSTDVNKPEKYRKTYKVKRVIMHKSYSPIYLDHDVALFELTTPVQFNTMVQPACLPRQGEQVPVGTPCYLTGFGKTRHPGSSSKVLMQAVLPVVSDLDCHKLNKVIIRNPISVTMMCAGNGPGSKQSGCHGDSGGPLVCKNKEGGFTLQGSVSWGSPFCDASDAYTVFARISHFRNWIDQNMA